MSGEWEAWEHRRTVQRRVRVLRVLLFTVGIALVGTFILTKGIVP